MGANSGFDAIVFGEVVFPSGGVMKWAQEIFHRLQQLEAFDAEHDDQLAQVMLTDEGVAVRAWLFADSFQEWCPRLEAMFAQAARQGGIGDVMFLGVGGPAFKLVVGGGRALLERCAAPNFADDTVQEIAIAVERKTAVRRAEVLAAIIEEHPADADEP